MKRFKKILTSIISMVLVIAMVGTGCAFAHDSSEKAEAPTLENAISKLGSVINMNDTVTIEDTVESVDHVGNCFVTSDLSDGNILMWLYQADGTLVYTSYFDRTTSRLYKVNEGEANVQVTTIRHSDVVYYAESATASEKEPSGLRYSMPSGASTGARPKIAAYDDDGVFMMNLDIDIWGVKTTSSTSQVNISGTYRDLAELVAFICQELLTSGTIANPFAILILGTVGIAATAVNIYLPDIYVAKSVTNVKWYAYLVGGNNSGTVNGSRTVCTRSNGSSYTKDSGYYYPINSLINHNNTLALNCYTSIFSGANGSVVSWSNVW